MGILERLGLRVSYPRVATDEQMVKDLGQKHRCPDCGHSKFYEGPHGGVSVNILCAWCGHEFNYCEPFPAMSNRNSSEFQPGRNWAFGLAKDWKPEGVAAHG